MDTIKVSVICMVYNHEKFIRKCLDGFIMQKTNFKYEVLINDDASIDNSAYIIKEYENKYPDLIKPIYQEENQFSKNKSIAKDILVPLAKGKYIAFCEGDDYWIDENKLQRQYDIMESNSEYSLCVHNTIRHDLLGKRKDELFNNWPNLYVLNEEDVFLGWFVHTSSYFFRKEALLYAYSISGYWCGDFLRITLAYDYGKIIYLNNIMSIYNYNNINGVTYTNTNNDYQIIICKENKRKDYLEEFNKFTQKRHNSIILKKISQIDFLIIQIEIDNANNMQEFNKKKKELKNNVFFKHYLSHLNMMKRLLVLLKYNNFYLYKFYKKTYWRIKNA